MPDALTTHQSSSTDTKTYWVNETGLDLAKEVFKRVRYWYDKLPSTLAYSRWTQGWRTYCGLPDANSPFDVSQLGFTGQEGELANLKINHVGSAGRAAVQMVMQSRPEMEPVPSNTDYASLAQAEGAKGILEYFLRKEGIEEEIGTANEIAISATQTWVFTTWDPFWGAVYDVDQQTGTQLHEGRIQCKAYMPWQVVTELRRQDAHHDWQITVDYINKWEMAAQYPAVADDILDLHDVTAGWASSTNQILSKGDIENDFIPVFTLYHAKTHAVPEGRWAVVLASDLILAEGPLPYDDLPGQMHSPGKLLNTPYGDSPLAHTLGIQDLINNLVSAVASNNINLARQTIVAPTGAGYSRTEIAEGLSWIEVDPLENGTLPMPQAINLVKSSPETYSFIKDLAQTVTVMMGQNSVTNGLDAAGARDLSGAAMVMLESQSIRFLSGLMASNTRLIEGIGTRMIQILKRYAKSPRMALIAGKTKQFTLKEFTGRDFENFDRVEVQQGNPGMRTPAFRMQLADTVLAKMPPGTISVQDYLTLIETGSLDTGLEPSVTERLNVQKENEALRSGQPVPVMVSDNPSAHIKGHLSVLDDPDARTMPGIVQAVTQHVMAHMQAWKTADPALLQLMGYPMPPPPPMPMLPPGMPPPGPPGPPGAHMPPGHGVPGTGPAPGHGPPPKPVGPMLANPNEIHPGAAPPKAPVNPMTGQRPQLPPGSSAQPH